MAIKMKTRAKDQELQLLAAQVVQDLLKEVAAARIDFPGSERRLLAKIDNILKQFGFKIQELVPPMLIAEYFGGVDEANRLLAEGGLMNPDGLALTKDGLIAQNFQKPIHLNAVEELIDDTMGDMGAALAMTGAHGADAINTALENVRGELVKGQIRGDTRKKIQAAVQAQFLAQGMTAFRTKDGKWLPLDFYAMTVTRTKTRTATVQGSANRFMERGQDLVQIKGNGDTCEICARFQGMVLSLSGDSRDYPYVGDGIVSLPPYHPNCRCAISPYMLRSKTDEEIEAAKRRNAEFDTTTDRRTPAQKAAYENEQRLRRIANAEKKQFMRWQAELGAEAPKTLAAFRRMKRQNTVQFQQLQSEFRSARQTGIPRAPRVAPPIPPVAAARVPAPPIVAPPPVAAPVASTGPTISPTLQSTPATPFNERGYYRARKEDMRAIGEENYAKMGVFSRETVDDLGAYNSYVANGNSFAMNRFLYSGEYDKYKSNRPDNPDQWDMNEIKTAEVDKFSALIQKYNIPEKMRAYRMVDGDFMDSVLETVGLSNKVYFEPNRKSTHAEYLKTAKLGLTGVRFKNKSFMSTSYDPGENVFLERPFRMELLVDEGQKGLITKNHFESEIVFDKDTELEFLDFEILEDDGGGTFMNILTRVVK